MRITQDHFAVLSERFIGAMEEEQGELSLAQRAQALGVIEGLFAILSEMLPEDLTEDYVKHNPERIWDITVEYLFRSLRQHPGNAHYSDDEIRNNLDPKAVTELAFRMEFVALELATFVPLIDLSTGERDWDPDAELAAMLGEQ